MKALLLTLVISILPPYTQHWSGALQPGEVHVERVLGFKKHATIKAELKGSGKSDLDCYFVDGRGDWGDEVRPSTFLDPPHLLGKDETNTDDCRLYAKNDDKVFFVVVNHGWVPDTYAYTFTGE
jgi:hypothetical protein